MLTRNEKVTVLTVNALRSKAGAVLKQLADHPVILQRRNKPVAVMLGYSQYEQFNKLLDLAEEYVLGVTALERDKKSSKKDFIDIKQW